MAFENLSDKLNSVFKKLRGKGRLTAADVKEGMREVRMALLEADVNFKVVKQFIAQVKEEFKKQGVKLKKNDLEGVAEELWKLNSNH